MVDGSPSGGRRRELSDFARAGFQRLSNARQGVEELAARIPTLTEPELLRALGTAADPDSALGISARFADTAPSIAETLGFEGWIDACRLFGASSALGEYFIRHPALLPRIVSEPAYSLPSEAEMQDRLLAAVTGVAGETAWNRLRITYRELLAQIVLFDLAASAGSTGEAVEPDPVTGPAPASIRVFEDVARSLTGLADAALEAGLQVARAAVAEHLVEREGSTPEQALAQAEAVRLAVVAMGKSGAQELNVVSDVDVLFVYEGDERLATRLAREMMRAIHDHAFEPALWQVDANLRPEGRHGALVRTLPGMLGYYERWAKSWEFQALLKARPCAGDLALGREFVEATRPHVWASATREDFVGSVQRMRERVTEHIDPDEAERHVKLGPGGLRDIEFSVQLLQLVHGARDESLRLAGTLPALRSLVHGGYVARRDGERLGEYYRKLRVLEHRLQLQHLRRTALMPVDEEELRVLARATGFAHTAQELQHEWDRLRREVRLLHLKIFYAPLLSAITALPDSLAALPDAIADLPSTVSSHAGTGSSIPTQSSVPSPSSLATERAEARLASIGFGDPAGAIRHLTALTRGSSRSTKILQHLLPVLLRWFGEGTDPDYGVLAFRRITEANREASWYLRLLRDGALAAERLALVLTNSRFAAKLLESHPEGVAWLEKDELLTPPAPGSIRTEMTSIALRQSSTAAAAAHVRRVHRREVLRLAMGRVCGVIGDDEVAVGLDAAHTALLEALLGAVLHSVQGTPPEIALIGMGRFGGGELGFASDIDLLAVSREADPIAARCIAELRELVGDPRFSVDLDFDLRPEGKNGPIVRSLSSYEHYYAKWSLTWEAQALLRARHAGGSRALSDDFLAMIAPIRYPASFSDDSRREVRTLKARMEAERLPHGADPAMHVKLGPGGLSDVEWLVQLLQLEYAHRYGALRTVSTLGALEVAADLRLLGGAGATLTDSKQRLQTLSEAWKFASSVRSALKLWNGRSSDILPFDWRDLAGIAGILGLPRDQTSHIIEQWRSLSRRARRIFEEDFFGMQGEVPLTN